MAPALPAHQRGASRLPPRAFAPRAPLRAAPRRPTAPPKWPPRWPSRERPRRSIPLAQTRPTHAHLRQLPKRSGSWAVGTVYGRTEDGVTRTCRKGATWRIGAKSYLSCGSAIGMMQAAKHWQSDDLAWSTTPTSGGANRCRGTMLRDDQQLARACRALLATARLERLSFRRRRRRRGCPWFIRGTAVR